MVAVAEVEVQHVAIVVVKQTVAAAGVAVAVVEPRQSMRIEVVLAAAALDVLLDPGLELAAGHVG